ncbi:MAG: hypothetical protein ACON4V_07360 [Parvibaculales bacterium]
MPDNGHNKVKQAVAQHKLQRLKKLVTRCAPQTACGPNVLTGLAAIDAYLTQDGGGGVPQGGLHEVVAARPGDMAAALGFAHRLAAQFLAACEAETILLYGQTHTAVREGGQPYAPALAAHDLSGAHLAYLDGVTLPDLLWAGEEALACPAIGCSVLASWDAAPDFTASRRLSLAARAALRPLVLTLGAAAAGTATAATTRWQVSSLPQQAWQVQLVKSRLAYQAMPPAQGWTVYPRYTALPMQPIADDETATPLMAVSAVS